MQPERRVVEKPLRGGRTVAVTTGTASQPADRSIIPERTPRSPAKHRQGKTGVRQAIYRETGHQGDMGSDRMVSFEITWVTPSTL